MSHEPLRLRSRPPDPAAARIADRPHPGLAVPEALPRGSEDPSATTLRWTPRPDEPRRRPAYHLGRRIGAGGFAEVFEAELYRPPLVPQRVALKRLLPGLRAEPARKRQLRREAQIAMRLDHENIVKVYELLELPELGDELLIAMELVDGLQASRLLRCLAERGRALRLPAVAYLLHGLFAALDYLETGSPLVDAAVAGPPLGSSRPLVHADISLENLMLTAAGGVKLIDFGLAGEDRSLPPLWSAGEDQSLTALHQVAGKPTYAPPGDGGRLPGAPTVQSDLYAAGVCAWELLTGRRFPALPPGAAARELGSLIAFAAEGLPAAGWQLLQLCLSADQTAQRCTAAQGLALIAELRPDTVSPLSLGALVQALAAEGPPTADAAAPLSALLTEPAAPADALQRRLHGAFCAHRVVVVRPGDIPRPAAPPAPRADLGDTAGASPGFAVPASPAADPASIPWATVDQARRRGQAEAPDGGLYYRVHPPGSASSFVLGVEPGPGYVYDPLAQALLRNLLLPESPAAPAPDPLPGFPSPRNLG